MSRNGGDRCWKKVVGSGPDFESSTVKRFPPKWEYLQTTTGWWCNNHPEKYEFVNGKDDIPYMKWKIKFMFETTNQTSISEGLLGYTSHQETTDWHTYIGLSVTSLMTCHHFPCQNCHVGMSGYPPFSETPIPSNAGRNEGTQRHPLTQQQHEMWPWLEL